MKEQCNDGSFSCMVSILDLDYVIFKNDMRQQSE